MSELLLGLWWNDDITSSNDGLYIGCLGLVLHRDLGQCPIHGLFQMTCIFILYRSGCVECHPIHSEFSIGNRPMMDKGSIVAWVLPPGFFLFLLLDYS